MRSLHLAKQLLRITRLPTTIPQQTLRPLSIPAQEPHQTIFKMAAESAARAFMATPNFAVVGASSDPSKFGHKSAFAPFPSLPLPSPLLLLQKLMTDGVMKLTIASCSFGMVPRALPPRDAHQPHKRNDQRGGKGISGRKISGRDRAANTDIRIHHHAPKNHSQRPAGRQGEGRPERVVAAWDLQRRGTSSPPFSSYLAAGA